MADFNKPPPNLHYYPPPSAPQPQIIMMNQAVPPQPDVPYKCLYLAVLIIDLIETIIGGFFIVIALFAVSLIQGMIDGSGSVVKMGDAYPQPASDASGLVTIIRLLLVAILVILILTQYYGWKGHNNNHVRSIYAFAFIKGFSVLFTFIGICIFGFSVMTFVQLALNGAFTAIPIMFGLEVSKLQQC